MSSITEDAANRRRRRLVSHIAWLQINMPASSSLQQRLRQLELLVGSDSNAVKMGSETVATVTNKKEQLESCSFCISISVRILEREVYASDDCVIAISSHEGCCATKIVRQVCFPSVRFIVAYVECR